MKTRTLLLAASLLLLSSCVPSPVRLETEGQGDRGFAVTPAVADWTTFKALRWKAENPSDQPVSLYVRLYEAGSEDPGFLKKYLLSPHSVRTITMDLPAPAPHPELTEDFRLMRNSPYGRLAGTFIQGVDYSRIGKVSFTNQYPLRGAEWSVSDLELLPGEKECPAAMRLAAEEFFPFIDRYGQFKHAEWPGKIHGDDDLQKARVAEEMDLATHPGPSGRSKFGGWTEGPRREATGHFRVEKLDGQWWMVDPDGFLFWSHGVVRVSHSCAVTPLEGKDLTNRCHYFEELPEEGTEFAPFYRTHDALLKPYYTARGIDSTYDFSSANLYRKYGKGYLLSFGDICHRRLWSWGLNTIANSSDKDICLMDRTPYTDRLEIVSEPIADTDGWWPVMDPFDPSFAASVERQLIERRREVEDPWCLGFFVDNEIRWGDDTHLAEVVLRCPPSQRAKQQFLHDLKAKYGTVAALNGSWDSSFASWDELARNRQEIKTDDRNRKDFLDFNRSLIHRYYRTIRDAFDRLAPGLLYLGCRFAGSLPDGNVRIGAQYCDVISLNRYAFTTEAVVLPDGIDKPVLIGEFHFGTLDRGLFHGGLVDVETQQNRGEAYARYVESALRHPQIIGVHWHQFSDQATTGRFDGEDFQVGLTDVCDTPYPETIAVIRKVGYGMYGIRSRK